MALLPEGFKIDSVLLSLTSVVAGFALTQFVTILRNWSDQKREARFSALILALHLEAYAKACLAPYAELSEFESSHGAVGSPASTLPEVPDYPKEVIWYRLGIDFTNAAQNLRVAVNAARRMLDGTATYGSEEDVWQEAADQGIEQGSAALKIASGLRAKHRLPPRLKTLYDDLEGVFRKETAAIKERLASMKGVDEEFPEPGVKPVQAQE